MSLVPDQETFAKPEAMLRVPVGLASPLWGLFAGAAMGGAAWWWMTRWTRPVNLEAMFGAKAEVETKAEVEVVALVAPVAEAVERGCRDRRRDRRRDRDRSRAGAGPRSHAGAGDRGDAGAGR